MTTLPWEVPGLADHHTSDGTDVASSSASAPPSSPPPPPHRAAGPVGAPPPPLDAAAATVAGETAASTSSRFGDWWRSLTHLPRRQPKPDDADEEEGEAAPRGCGSWCSCRNESPTTLRALCLATSTCVGTFAIFCASLVVLLLSLQQRVGSEPAGITVGFINGSSSSAINYTAAQERWVRLRDSLNVTLLSAETPQSEALRYLSLRESWHDLPQQYALAVVYYTWGGPWWETKSTSSTSSSSPTAGGLDDGTWMVTLPMTVPSDTDGASPSSAAPPPEECRWYGIECDSGGSVTALNLTDAMRFPFAQGSLPTELGMLSRLRRLIAPEHGLQGSIPTELAQLEDLRELDLRYNRLTGVSDFLRETARQGGTGSRLERVLWGFNSLRDEWTTADVSALAGWSRLQEFDVERNTNLGASTASSSSTSSANATVWHETVVPAWANLRVLKISQTLLELRLDDALGQWEYLTVLEAEGCALSGSLPSTFTSTLEILNLVAPTTRGVEGTLPTELGLWSRLDVLALDGNDLDATLPTEIGGLTSLTTFSAKFNYHLHGPIPTEIGNLRKLQFLHLGDTGISGTIPSELAQCTDLDELRLDSTQTWGTVPDELCHRRWEDFRADCPDPAYATTNLVSNKRVVECSCCTVCYGT